MNSIVAFGTELITSQDLDPIYTVLHHGELPRDQTKRWLLAYWCFYHAGFASYASEVEGSAFWHRLGQAAENITESPLGERWPRGTERRHFRGEKCVKAIEWFEHWGVSPEGYVSSLYDGLDVPTHKNIISRVTKWPQFGPWIGFKVADMLERCLGVPVQFSDEIALIYKEPRKALFMIQMDYKYAEDLFPYPEWEAMCSWDGTDHPKIYARLLDRFSHLGAPPSFDRPCSHQELETVLCKWKSHINGHYPMGKDSLELFVALEGWGSTAEYLQHYVP